MSETDPPTLAAPPVQTLRAVPLLFGCALLVIFMRIGSVIGYQAGYGPPLPPYHKDVPSPFVYVTGAEYRFWIAHLVFAIPGALLIAWGLAPRLAPVFRRLAARIDAAPARSWWIAAAALFVVLTLISAIGRSVILLGLPLTDDENAVTFGAKIIASGHLKIPILQPAGAYPDLFMFARDGNVSAMDFPGVLFFGAIAIVTQLGDLLYALACGVSGIAVAYAAGRWFGPRAAVIAAGVWVASPMVVSLSLTAHGHVPSRMFIALCLAFAARLDTGAATPRRDAILLGVCAGLGFLCRPLEAICLLAPLGAWITWRALRPSDSAARIPRATPLWMFGSLVPAIVAFALYNVSITGVWYLQARFSPGAVNATPADLHTAWERLAFNLGWNALLLAVFFLGIPAIVAVIAAFERRRPVTLVLGVSVLAGFLLCLTHDNTGIHSVGPIHLSEMTVPLTILVTAGITRGFEWLPAAKLRSATAAIALASYLVIACTAFNLTNFASLRMQATSQGAPAATLEALDIHHAVVMTRSYIMLLQINRSFAPWGSWVLDFPPPSPDLDDDIIFAKPTANPEDLHKRFPDRAIYKMTFAAEPPNIRVELLRAAN